MKNNTGIDNSGSFNSGDRNSGYYNSGSFNSGDRNSGYYNSGSFNSGYHNIGYHNSGDRNSGSFNSGDRNSGDRNSGSFNSGDRNSGNWNSCDNETGFFNTSKSDVIRVFNKPCSRTDWDNAEKPDFIFFDLCVWVDEKDMTDEQKTADPQFHVRGGQLQKKDYKQAWGEAYDKASKEDIELLKALPNFNADVFEELTGIRVDEPKSCDGRVVEIDGVKYELKKI